MNPDRLELYRWFIAVTERASPVARLREMERVVREQLAPALRDPVVREHVSGFHLWKRNAEEGEAAGAAGVGVDLFAAADADPPSDPVLASHLQEAGAVGGRGVLGEAAVILHPIAAEYRRGLTDISEVALDLHVAPQLDFRAHQCALIDAACSSADPRFQLQTYLTEHSAAYLRLARPEPEVEGELWSWAQEELWSRLYTPGPGRGLLAPIYSLWNIVLGTVPRRWTDRTELAARLGIDCG